MAQRIKVLFPHTPQPLDYHSEEPLPQGQVVMAPLRAKHCYGIVWEGAPNPRVKQLKEADPTGLPCLAGGFVEFLKWAGRWNCIAPYLLAKAALSGFDAKLFDAANSPAKASTKAPTKTSAKSPYKNPTKTPSKTQLQHASPELIAPKGGLTPLQHQAFAALETERVNLLDGVTGSGKSWVYFEAVARCLAQGKQAVILIPEIALGEQWQQNFQTRFRMAADVWHSGITPAVRKRLWAKAITGEARVIVGARSALFLPTKNLGLLVVDEEHDASYKQESGICYQARDMAVVRAKAEGAPLVLASATPSIESLQNADQNKYNHIRLPTKFAPKAHTHISLIDLNQHRPPPHKWLSKPLLEALEQTLAQKAQAMLFINRRGYAPITFCGSCQKGFTCPSCQSHLVRHLKGHRLCCHHCGYHQPLPQKCAECGSDDLISQGIGVEKLCEEVQQALPQARTRVLSSDYFDPEELTAIQRGEVDIIIGTQLLAKGHHFVNLKLIGVVDADMSLRGLDLRALERTWQLLVQLSGRAGRQSAGRALIQTHFPKHSVMEALVAGRHQEFLALEQQRRKAEGLPPFGSMAAVILSSKNAELVERTAHRLAQTAPKQPKGLEVFGPAPALLERINGYYRWRLLAKSNHRIPLGEPMARWLAQTPPPAAVRWKIDIDPYSFL